MMNIRKTFKIRDATSLLQENRRSVARIRSHVDDCC